MRGLYFGALCGTLCSAASPSRTARCFSTSSSSSAAAAAVTVPRSASDDEAAIREVLDSYCGPPDVDYRDRVVAGAFFSMWFRKSEETDRMLRTRFGDLLREAPSFAMRWEKSLEGKLALIVLWDQMGRNIYRGTPDMFSRDADCVRLAREVVALGEDKKLNLGRRSILYLPLMHSEELHDQELSMRKFQELATLCPEVFQNNLEFAKAHRDIVARFGRFPHRNAILGRKSTPEEEEFLKQPGSSF